MEPQYTPKTRELLDISAQLRTYISSTLPDQLQGQDISSPVSSYRQNEDTLKSALDRIINCLDIIDSNIDYVDQLPFNQKNNLHSYISQVLSWLQQGIISTWPNVISYAETLQVSLLQYGITESGVIDKETSKAFIAEYKKARAELGDLRVLKSLKKELEDIKEANVSIPTAQGLINAISNNKSISEAKKAAEKILSFADEVSEDIAIIKDLKRKKTLDVLDSKFKEQSNFHRRLANKWLALVASALVFFCLSAVYVIMISIGLEYPITIVSPTLPDVNDPLTLGLLLIVMTIIVKLVIAKNYSAISFLLSFILVVIGLFYEPRSFTIPQIAAVSFDSNIIGIFSNFLIRSIILAPSILILVYSTRAYNRNIELSEQYEYKFISSVTFDTIINKASEIDPDFNTQMVTEAIVMNIYSQPNNKQDVKQGNLELGGISVEKFLQSNTLAKFIDIVSKLKK